MKQGKKNNNIDFGAVRNAVIQELGCSPNIFSTKSSKKAASSVIHDEIVSQAHPACRDSLGAQLTCDRPE